MSRREGSFLLATESLWAHGLKGPFNYKKGSRYTHQFKHVGSWFFKNLWIFPKWVQHLKKFNAFLRALLQIMRIIRNTFLPHLPLSCFCLLTLLSTLHTDNGESRDTNWGCMNYYTCLFKTVTDVEYLVGCKQKIIQWQNYHTLFWNLLYIAKQLYLCKKR